MSYSGAFKDIFLVLLVVLLNQPIVEGMNPMGLHQQRRSSSLEELLQHRNTRSFPYSSVSYMRMLPPSSQGQQVINPKLIFSPFPSGSLGRLRTNQDENRQRILTSTGPEISELIDLLDNLKKEGQLDNQAAGTTNVVEEVMDRERRSASPIVKRYACRFKFCRIFDA